MHDSRRCADIIGYAGLFYRITQNIKEKTTQSRSILNMHMHITKSSKHLQNDQLFPHQYHNNTDDSSTINHSNAQGLLRMKYRTRTKVRVCSHALRSQSKQQTNQLISPVNPVFLIDEIHKDLVGVRLVVRDVREVQINATPVRKIFNTTNKLNFSRHKCCFMCFTNQLTSSSLQECHQEKPLLEELQGFSYKKCLPRNQGGKRKHHKNKQRNDQQ